MKFILEKNFIKINLIKITNIKNKKIYNNIYFKNSQKLPLCGSMVNNMLLKLKINTC